MSTPTRWIESGSQNWKKETLYFSASRFGGQKVHVVGFRRLARDLKLQNDGKTHQF